MGEAVDLGMRPSAVLSKLRASASQCSLLLSRHRDSVAVHFTTILFYHFYHQDGSCRHRAACEFAGHGI